MVEKKFYQLTVEERRKRIQEETACSDEDLSALTGITGLSEETAERMIENVVGKYSLPIGIARNFVVNDKHYEIPMVIEEPSVVAAASNGARLAAVNGGFRAEADPSLMIGQIQLLGINDLEAAKDAVNVHKKELLQAASERCAGLIKRGGGPVDIEVREFSQTPVGGMLVLHLILDVCDVMGANLIDSALEAIAPLAEKITGGTVRLRILSNFADRRLARASCEIPVDKLAFQQYSGSEVAERIIDASVFAQIDPYRAVTHNKGIMNGIDAVLLAIGNDWRAVEAGAHAWAARDGQIKPLSIWSKDPRTGNLQGKIELPMAVAVAGGATKVHPGASAALNIMGVQSARELAGVIAAVGLAQNLAALKALSTEGIQRGHMSLHARQLAVAAGAQGELADRIAAKMAEENNISLSYAAELTALEKEKTHA